MLSKSDFILASSCTKKLVYKKAGYPTSNDTNEYMQMLAKGGYVVGLYAQLMYPEGIEVKGGSPERTSNETKRLLSENENITLFEACFIAGDKIVRTDILVKRGNELHIIEVKSVSHDSENDSSKQKRKLREYMLDLAFQTLVVQESCPGYSIRSSLFIPDTNKRTIIEGLGGWFHILSERNDNGDTVEFPGQQRSRFKKPEVVLSLHDNQDRDVLLNALLNDCLLSIKPCDEEVAKLMPSAREASELHIEILKNGIQPHHYSRTKNCHDCEFRADDDSQQNGYKECWGALADADPHIFDLYAGGAIGHHTSGYYLDELIRDGRTSFHDLDIKRFYKKDGELGTRGERQLIQYQQTLAGAEYKSPLLNEKLNSLQYPLHFIDFETYISALPHHAGMRPYEKITFQWSCHTIPSPGADMIHSEYLNDTKAFPNFTFAETLMHQIGDTGTPLMWSTFENTTLKDVLAQMDTFGHSNNELRDWLLRITSDSDKKKPRPGRFVDMNDLCLKYYFHPYMKGKTSIKKVLPAVWNHNPWLHDDPWFADYRPQSGMSLNPYDHLSNLLPDLEAKEIVDEGTAAMMAYHDMMYGISSSDPQKRSLIRQSLLNYCKLDTLAMVIIWKYWMSKGPKTNSL